jgi:hypothetical protein
MVDGITEPDAIGAGVAACFDFEFAWKTKAATMPAMIAAISMYLVVVFILSPSKESTQRP